MRRLLWMAALAAAIALTGACGDDGGTAAESPSPTPATEFSSENKLPEDFPENVPLPEDYDVAFSTSAAQAKVVYFRTDTKPEELLAFFSDAFAKDGWTITQCGSASAAPTTEGAGAPVAFIAARNAGLVVSLSIGDTPIPMDPASIATARPGNTPVPTATPEPAQFLIAVIEAGEDAGSAPPAATCPPS